MKQKHHKILTSQYSSIASRQHPLGKSLDDKVEKKNIPLCPHNEYCGVRKIKGYNCFLAQEAKNCETYKFYERYGEGWDQLGVGS